MAQESPVTTANVISGCVVLLMAFALLGGIMQNQFSHLEQTMETAAKLATERDTLLRTEADKLSDELKGRIADVHNELRHDVVSQNEFGQFLARYDTTNGRLAIIEAEIALDARTRARNPVEKETIDAIVDAIHHSQSTFQSVLDDLNKQIAAKLIVDNGPRK